MQFCEVQNALRDRRAASITAADTTHRDMFGPRLHEALEPLANAGEAAE